MEEFERRRVVHPEGGRVMTKQSDAGETDINVIVRRARQVGALPPDNRRPRYGDFADGASFHEKLSLVREAEDQFQQLPARVRQLCQNDPGMFLDMIDDEESLQLLVEAGLEGVRLPERSEEPAPAPTPDPAPAPPPEP